MCGFPCVFRVIGWRFFNDQMVETQINCLIVEKMSSFSTPSRSNEDGN